MKKEVPTLIKWAGGKKQLLSQFEKFFPKKIERYFEPFVGGGSVAFYLLKTHPEIKKIFLSDINEELIITYNIVKDDIEELIKLLKKYKLKHSKEFYYEIRSQDTKDLNKLQIAARFIYLNKTCFNGLYRVNSKGQFNVPIGSYKNPQICNEKDLREISKFLKKDDVKVSQFDKAVKKAKKRDFIYFDPPYYPLKNKKSFTTYTKDNFLEKEQKKLAKVFRELDKKGCKVMLSNSDTDFIKNLYKGYNINFVQAKRMINCDATKRGKINEVVITNYDVENPQKKLK
ncbi:MAG: DNA adenine methylase [Candidatus Pacearchaeota archaeon]|nr:DNA adenine methylase [Candidatus Pacearchaeota archaeon]